MSPNIFRWLYILFTKVQILAVVFDSLHVFLLDEIPSLFYFFLNRILKKQCQHQNLNSDCPWDNQAFE